MKRITNVRLGMMRRDDIVLVYNTQVPYCGRLWVNVGIKTNPAKLLIGVTI